LVELLVDGQISSGPVVIESSNRAQTAIAIALSISRYPLIHFLCRSLNPKFDIIIELEILRIEKRKGASGKEQIGNEDASRERGQEMR
jgi:hypothetical protein